MREELDEALCAKYPKIFANRHGDMKETLMCWGFEHGDGWYQILDSLCANIQSHIDWQNENFAKGYPYYEKPVPQVVAQQVKEKFGTLRFYYNGGDDVIDGMVRIAESWSAVACEECGAPGTQNSQGWIKTLCETHRKERDDCYAQSVSNHAT
jgi:hypothetical protein